MTELKPCSKCFEMPVSVLLPDGTYFVRVRRASFCKNYPKTKNVGMSCRTEAFSTEEEAIYDWNNRND